jgi:hypothetical protein
LPRRRHAAACFSPSFSPNQVVNAQEQQGVVVKRSSAERRRVRAGAQKAKKVRSGGAYVAREIYVTYTD